MKTKLLNILIIFALSGCGSIEDGRIKPPLVYRIDIQQGNVIEQSMINRLKVGMDKKQVRFILGTPLLIDPFHPERWEYFYYYRKSNKKPEQRHITVYFKDNKLSHLSGDIKVSNLPIEEDPTRTEKSVVVPDEYSEKGLLDRWLRDKPKETEEETASSEAPESEDMKLTETPEETPDIKAQSEETETKVAEEKTGESDGSEHGGDENDEPGFFSRMWDKIKPGSDDESEGSEVLNPELENK